MGKKHIFHNTWRIFCNKILYHDVENFPFLHKLRNFKCLCTKCETNCILKHLKCKSVHLAHLVYYSSLAHKHHSFSTSLLWRTLSITWAISSLFISSKSSKVESFPVTFPCFTSSWMKFLKINVDCSVWNNFALSLTFSPKQKGCFDFVLKLLFHYASIHIYKHYSSGHL